MKQFTLLLLSGILTIITPVWGIPDPAAWYDAGDITGLDDQDYVNTWPDKSGNGLDLTTVNQAYWLSIRYDSSVSSLNNQPAVHWVGGNNPPASGSANHVYMRHAADSELAGTAYTVFVVGDFTTLTNSSVVSVLDNSSTDDTQNQAALLGYAGQNVWHVSSVGNYAMTATSGGSACILEGLFDTEPNDVAVYRNGTVGNGTIYDSGSPADYTNISRGIFLGKGDYWWAGWTYPTMDIAEVIIYNRKLTTSERNEVGAYLQGKYGIPGSYISPAIMPAPTAWYDASDLTGLNDQNYVDTWPDKSGNDLDLTTVNQAYWLSIRYDESVSSLNNLPAVHWGGGNNPPYSGSAYQVYMRHDADSDLAGDGYTIFTVGDFTSIASNAAVVNVLNNSSTDDTQNQAAFLGYGGQNVWHVSSIGNYAMTATSGGSACILEGLYGTAPNDIAVYRNGTVGNGTIYSSGSPADYTDISRGIFLGHGDYWHTNWTYPTMDIAEVIIYNRRLTDGERNRVGVYLQDKYGISGSYISPAIMPAPTAWYDASEITGLVDQDNVNTWPDKSGNDLDLTTVNQDFWFNIRYDASVSSLNYMPAVYWGGDGSQHPPAAGSANYVYMRHAADSDLAGDSYTVFAVGDFATLTNSSVVSVLDNSSTDDTQNQAALLGYGGQNVWHVSSIGNYAMTATSGGSACILEGLYGTAPNDVAVYRNGTVGNGTIYSSGSPADYTDISRGIFLGHGDYWSTSWTYPTMDLAEVIIYNRTLNSDERNAVGSYLQNKYEIAGSYTQPADFVGLYGSLGAFHTATWEAQMVNGEICYFRNKLTNTAYIFGGTDSGSAVKTCTLYASHGGTNTASGPAQDVSYDPDNVYTFGTATRVTTTGPYEITWSFSNNGVASTIRAWIDQTTHELCIQQESSGSYSDIHRVRWAITNIDPDLDVIIPTSGGIRINDADDVFGRKYFMWPYYWHSQFVVLNNGSEGFYVHADDPDDWFKGLEVDRTRTNNALGFDTEDDTPFTSSSLSSVVWRISTFQGVPNQGSWTLPVHQVREWMADNFTIASRPSWVDDIKLVSFNAPPISYGHDPAYNQLDEYIGAENVLLGTTNWRYYIDFTGTAGGWLHRAPEYATIGDDWSDDHDHWKLTHGFRTMIWINPWQCRNDDPNTGYNVYSTFSPSDHIQNPMNSSEYWPTWYSGTANINSTCDAWRATVIGQLSQGVGSMNTAPDGIMLDESFGISQDCSGYTDGWINMCDGYQQFESELLAEFGGILAGEGLNDVTFRQEAFAHIHGYGNTSVNGRFVIPTSAHARLCPVFAVLYSPYTKLYGFWGLDGVDTYSEQCNEAYKILRMEPAIHPMPGTTLLTENNGTEMNDVVQEMVDRANGSNEAPTLTSCSVSPSSGSILTSFTFSCIYTDADNDGPGQSASPNAYVHLVIDDIVYDLNRDGTASYTGGKTFSLKKGNFDTGTHYYHFECWDSWKVVRYPTSGESSFTISASAPGKAFCPSPSNSAAGISITADLSWTVGSGANSHNVYFGMDSTPDETEYIGNQVGTAYDPGNLTANTTYYWRIDEVSTGGTTTGDVWSFTTAPAGKATSPSPSNSAPDRSVTADLNWTAGSGANSHNVYFGTDSTPDETEYIGNQTGTTYDPGLLTAGTTYYWRIDEVGTGGTTTGDIWSFTTAAPATIFTDAFETDFNKWTDGGTTDWDRTTSYKYSGSYSAHAGSADNDLISDNVNTSGYYSMKITCWYRDDDIDDDDNIYLQLYDGTAYDNKFELGNSSPEDTWYQYQTTIYNTGSDAQYFISSFRLKFEGTSIDSGENLWIDDVSIVVQY